MPYTPSQYFGELVAQYDMTQPPYFIQQPIMVPIGHTIQVGMGLWLPSAPLGSGGTYAFESGEPSSGFEIARWHNGTSDPDSPALRQAAFQPDWESGPFFADPLPVNYSFAPPGPVSQIIGSQDAQGPSTFAIPHDQWNDSTDIYFNDYGPKGGDFSFSFPGPPEWATSVTVGITALDNLSWGAIWGEASYSLGNASGVQGLGGEGFHQPSIGNSWYGQDYGHNFMGGTVTVRMWAETDQETWADVQAGKSNGGIGRIRASASYTPAYPHKLYFYALRPSLDGGDGGGLPVVPCPPSTWPYADPIIAASPGPTGVIRWDRWK